MERQVNEKDSADGALPIVQAWKTKHGNEMTGVLAYNDPSALGAVAARGGDFNPVVTGMNADPPPCRRSVGAICSPPRRSPTPRWATRWPTVAFSFSTARRRPSFLFGRCDVITKANAAKYVPWPVRNKSAMKVAFVKSGAKTYFVTVPSYGIK